MERIVSKAFGSGHVPDHQELWSTMPEHGWLSQRLSTWQAQDQLRSSCAQVENQVSCKEISEKYVSSQKKFFKVQVWSG